MIARLQPNYEVYQLRPFPETQNYVQRVIENYEVYKARLGQPADIERDLIGGRSSS